jgi:predicted ATPase
VTASNWRNFKALSFVIRDRLFIVGPNASGKSNLLDLFRFPSDIAKAGGGLAAATEKRGGLGKARSLFARNYHKGRLIVELELADGESIWKYRLAIKGEGAGRNRPIVDEERVEHDGQILLDSA